MLSFFLLALASLALAAGSYDQCYFEAGYVGPQSLLPCLSANETQNGVSWCCLAGHYCVNQACYDASSGVTYQYGCNDPTYKDKNCPVKGGLDPAKSAWVGLVQCASANEGELKYWACNHPDTCGDNCPTEPDNPQETQSVWPWELQPLPPLGYCDELGKRVLAMYARSSLGSTGGVPKTYVVPTGKPSPTRPPLRSTISTATTGGFSSTAQPASSPALGGGAIAGIAGASTVVLVSLICALIFLVCRRRARRRDANNPPTANQDHKEVEIAELPDEKLNLMVPNTPSAMSEAGLKRPVSDMTLTIASQSPLGTPRCPGSPFHNHNECANHVELADEPKVIHEMPAINERAEMP